ncbi:MAG TPA: filamentous hemagglutinin N-terminal domain-containing protein, partial [Microcoleaceae cyanobacterium]
MTRQRIPRWQWASWQLGLLWSLAVCSGWFSLGDRALAQLQIAQIQPDNTLGNENSVVRPNQPVKGLPAELIEGGATRGSSLFHSFLEFNVREGQRVYFANPQGIANIFSRITGNSASNIFGTLGVNGAANLFLLNPNGILFGANARLDIAGSFAASTANRITFPMGFDFSATDPQAPPLLVLNVTPGLQYGESSPGATIVNRGQLTTGQDLTLNTDRLDLQGQLQAGHDLSLQAQTTVEIRDTTTTPFLAASGGNLTVQGNQGIDILVLNHPGNPVQSGGNLSLLSDGQISADAHFAGGGNFAVRTVSGGAAQFVSRHDPIMNMAGDIDLGGFYGGASLAATAGGNITYGTVGISAIDPAVHPTNPALILNAGGRITGNGTIFTPDGISGLIVSFQSQGNIDIRDIYTNGGSISLTSTAGNINTTRGPRLVTSGGAITLNANGNINTRDLGSASGVNGGDI